jgi:hypothetical protein
MQAPNLAVAEDAAIVFITLRHVGPELVLCTFVFYTSDMFIKGQAPFTTKSRFSG